MQQAPGAALPARQSSRDSLWSAWRLRAGWLSGTRGWSKPPACVMPRRRITAIDRWLSSTAKETISARSSVSRPKRSRAFAASVTYPRPVLRRQSPADLHGAVGEDRHQRGRREPGEADACAARAQLKRGEAEAAAGDRLAQLVEEGVRLGARSPERIKRHVPVVGIDALQKVAIAILPVADHQPLCLEQDVSHPRTRRARSPACREER